MFSEKNSDMGLVLILVLSIITIIAIIAFIVLPDTSSVPDKEYSEGVNLIESIKFDDLQTSTFSNGIKIEVSPSAEYPADKIVTYKEIVFPVENHNGKSKAVAMYSLIQHPY